MTHRVRVSGTALEPGQDFPCRVSVGVQGTANVVEVPDQAQPRDERRRIRRAHEPIRESLSGPKKNNEPQEG